MAGQERYILDSREYVDLVVYTLKKKNPIITSCNIRTYIFFYHRDIENVENIKINDFYFIYFFFFSVSFQDSFPINLPYDHKKEFRSFKGRNGQSDLTNTKCPHWFEIKSSKCQVLSATRLDGPRREAERSRSKRS